MKKIVLCGSISTGKTTTFDCLKAVFNVMNPMDRTLMDPGPKVRFTGEAASEIFIAHPDLKRDSYAADLAIASKTISNEERFSRYIDVEVLVCDRGVLDSIAFAETHKGYDISQIKENKRLIDHIKTYDKFLLFDPVGVPYVSTDIRVEGKDFRDRLHENFIDVLEEFGVEWELVSGPVSRRVVTVMDQILKLNS